VKGSLPWLVPGSTAVVLGAGGLGHIAVQLLRAMSPARVVAVDRSPAALELAHEVGADLVVPADGGQVSAVRADTGGSGVAVVLDFVGDGDTPRDGLAMVGRGGRYVAVGYGGRLETDVYDLVGGEITVAGSLVGTLAELAELVALAEAARVSVRTRCYPLQAVADAMADLRAGAIVGRAVLVPAAA
jgi:NAD+-dependent secondary alcohol dehydrogenase Adh1